MDVVFSKAAADEFNLVTGFVALGFNPSTYCDLADFTRGNQEFFVYVFKIITRVLLIYFERGFDLPPFQQC